MPDRNFDKQPCMSKYFEQDGGQFMQPVTTFRAPKRPHRHEAPTKHDFRYPETSGGRLSQTRCMIKETWFRGTSQTHLEVVTDMKYIPQAIIKVPNTDAIVAL